MSLERLADMKCRVQHVQYSLVNVDAKPASPTRMLVCGSGHWLAPNATNALLGTFADMIAGGEQSIEVFGYSPVSSICLEGRSSPIANVQQFLRVKQ